jgi:hypothetical protein
MCPHTGGMHALRLHIEACRRYYCICVLMLEACRRYSYISTGGMHALRLHIERPAYLLLYMCPHTGGMQATPTYLLEACMRYDYISRHAGATTIYVSSYWRHAGATPTYLLEACMRYDYISSVLHIYYYTCVLILEACRRYDYISKPLALFIPRTKPLAHTGGKQALRLHI